MWKDFKWVEKRFGTKFANILKGFDKGSKEIEEHFTTKENHEVTFTDANGVQNTLVTEQGISEVLAKNGLIEVKWQELKDKRDSGKLIPGSLYRITDYNCTTTQENTQSAGHQFDIVLLALSENKLAEEGWAMMNESNIYDVTFTDGVTKKCYLYEYDEDYNIIDVQTLLGVHGALIDDEIIIDEEKKVVTNTENGYSSTALGEENLAYNYFQNSNLSAWKVWYCLDNDKSRFGWADDKIGLKISVNGNVYITTGREGIDDKGEYLDWGQQYKDGGPAVYSKGTPKIGDSVYTWTGSPSSPTWITLGIVEEIEITNGRGVIYRLIDEWNNDVAYDFKNILQKTRFTEDGEWDENAPELYCYTFSMGFDDIKDASVVSQREVIVRNNKIEGTGEALKFKHVIFAPGDYSTGLNIIGNYIDAISEICIGLGRYSSCIGYKFTNSFGLFIVSDTDSDRIITRNYAMVGSPSSVQRTQVVDDTIDLWW